MLIVLYCIVFGGVPVGIATKPRGKGPAHLGPYNPNPLGLSLESTVIMGVLPRSPKRQSRPRAPHSDADAGHQKHVSMNRAYLRI